jgi:tetratricopeptide (TPR) repeat protein
MAHCNLGLALEKQGRLGEAVAAFRQAVGLKPDFAWAHCDLGVVLWKQGRRGEALAALRNAVRLQPGFATAHYNLGNVLVYSFGNVLIDKGRLDEAVAAYRRAIDLKPDLAEAHCNLGLTLQLQGEFAAALAALKRGHELGSRCQDWPYPSAQWVRECRRQVELDGRLAAVLRGEAQPSSAAERSEYARLCYYKKVYAPAARLWADAFRADPKLADSLKAGHRYDAACAAALAGCVRGADADQIDDRERARWRKQALEWLRADLVEWRRLLGKEPAKASPVIAQ